MSTGKDNMKIKRGRRPISILTVSIIMIVALLLLLMGGCNVDGPGIFYTISRVEQQTDTALSELNVKAIIDVGGTVYAGAGTSVWKQSSSGWSNITPSGMGADPSIATDGIDLFAALYSDSDGDRVKKIYSYDGSWSAVADSPSGVTLQLLDTSGDYFAVVSDDNAAFSVYQSSAITTPVGISDFVFDAAYDGAEYILVGGDSDTPLAWHSTDYTTAITSFSSGLGGVCYDGSDFFLTAKDGKVYKYDGAVTEIDTAPDNYSGSTPKLYDIVHLSDEGIMVIGSDEGYYEFNGSTITRPTATIGGSVNIEASYPDFASGIVRTFLDTTGTGFLLGTGSGVWENNGSELKQK